MKKLILILCPLLAISFSIPSYALFDPFGPLIYSRQWAQMIQNASEAAKRFEQLKQQYTQLSNLYQNAQERLTQAKTLVSDNSGHYSWGSLGNSQKDLTNREWSPSDWKSALSGLSGGNPARYQELVKEYKKNHPQTLNDTDYQKGASKTNNQVYQQQVKVNQAASVNASYAFNDIKQHLTNLHNLSMQIEKTKNTKSALDLLARIVTEQSYISVQELKMQTLLNEQVASQQSGAIAAETTSAKFNSLPNK